MNEAGSLLASFASPSCPSPHRIAILADPHLAVAATGSRRVYEKTVLRLETAVADVIDRDVDVVLVLGDLARDGREENFERAREILNRLSAPVLVVPGNHDVPGRRTDVDPADRFDGLAHIEATYDQGSFPFHWSHGDLEIIGLDSASPVHADGPFTADPHVPETDLAWLAETLADATTPIVALHHPVLGTERQFDAHSRQVETDIQPTFLANGDALVEILDRHDVPLCLTGHLHVPAVSKTGAVREVTVPSTCTYPQGYVRADVEESGTTLRYVPVADTTDSLESYAALVEAKGPLGHPAFAASRLASLPLRVEPREETDRALDERDERDELERRE